MKKLWQRWSSKLINRTKTPPKRSRLSGFSRNIRLNRYFTKTSGYFLLIISLLLMGTFVAQAQQGSKVFMPLAFANWDETQTVITAANDLFQTKPNSSLLINEANGVLANDSITNSDQLQAVLVEDVSNGTIKLEKDGSFEYSPNSDFSGQDEFSYEATNGKQKSNLAKVTLIVEDTDEAPSIVTGEIAFEKQIIGTSVGETHSVIAADLDGDSLIDVAATNYTYGRVPWFKNDGNGNFIELILDPDLEGAYPSHVGDVDLDGDPDVFAGGYLADIFAWYRNDGGGSFQRIDIDTAADGAHSLVTGDLDIDGDIDLITTWQDLNSIVWYENNGQNEFTRHIIDNTSLQAKRAEIADIDGDGDIDLFTAAYESNEIAWFENDGNNNFTKHIISSTALGAYYVSPADIDGDGDMDAFAASQDNNTVAWYENDGSENFIYHLINDNAFGVRTVITADIDNDGDADAISASVDADTIHWYRNDGSGNFTILTIDDAVKGVYGLFVIDIDFDGDIDVLSAIRDTAEIAIHYQFKAHTAAVQKGGSLVISSTLLQTIDADDGPTDIIYELQKGPVYGQLWLNGTAVTVGGTFTQNDINNKRISYVHDGGNSSTDEFTFSVADGGEHGFNPVTGKFTISIVN